MNNSLRSLIHNPYAWVILITFTIRISTMGFYPLGDTTEARYGEMARKMVETGNWITPQFDYTVPFWGKPPLSIWIHAISFKIFGISEFTARLPSILISLLIIFIVYYIARQQREKNVAWMASALLSTSVLFFLLSGTVIMDPLMTLGSTLSMLAFWQTMQKRGLYWGYLFFIGISIGLMSKGPIAFILVSMPIFIWLSISGNWRQCWQSLPIFSGTALMLALSLPWYIVAEYATPGFLDYFILGEHWARYTQPGWQGDLYGSAHTSYTGAIWVEWLKVAFPLSPALIAAIFILFWKKKFATLTLLREDWILYLLLWSVTPMVFFTFSGNILPTYVLPGMPAAALLVAGLWQHQPVLNTIKSTHTNKKILFITMTGLVFPFIYLVVFFFLVPVIAERSTEKFLIEKYQQIDQRRDTRLIYLYKRPFSAQYYSSGKAELVTNTKEMKDIISEAHNVYFAVPHDYLSHISTKLNQCLYKIGRYGRHILYRSNKKICS